MSPQHNTNRSSLFGVLFIPVLVIGAMIVVAILVMSYNGSDQRAVASDSHVRQLSDATLARFRNKYDALGQSMGSKNAPVTIREFGDYQCPACGAFESEAEKIQNKYVASGKVRFIFFDFPLQMHEHAHQAAIAARCAARQNRFWPYHAKLYKTQDQWSQKDNPTSSFLDLAVETGVDSDKLKRCMANKTPAEVIQHERAAGQAIQLRATPTVIIGHTMFSGAPTYQRMQEMIKAELTSKDDGKG